MRESTIYQSHEEYDYEDIEKKSEEFLKRIIGEEKFDNLQKNGKIEIEVNNESNDKTVYELYSDGRVINKTKNQSYCIVADRSDYPINDMVAIKYAWLAHRNDIVEKVANKTHLYTGIVNRAGGAPAPAGYNDFVREMEQRGWNRQQVNIGGNPGYAEYVDYMSGNDWHRELIVLDENNTNIVSTLGVGKDATGIVADIRCPAGAKISIMGIHQVPRGADARVAYSLGLYITDENGEEIQDDIEIKIKKVRPSEAIVQLVRIYYRDIKMAKNGHICESSYRFPRGVEINGEEHLMIYIINPPNNIPAENVKFKMEADLWARYS